MLSTKLRPWVTSHQPPSVSPSSLNGSNQRFPCWSFNSTDFTALTKYNQERASVNYHDCQSILKLPLPRLHGSICCTDIKTLRDFLSKKMIQRLVHSVQWNTRHRHCQLSEIIINQTWTTTPINSTRQRWIFIHARNGPGVALSENCHTGYWLWVCDLFTSDMLCMTTIGSLSSHTE